MHQPSLPIQIKALFCAAVEPSRSWCRQGAAGRWSVECSQPASEFRDLLCHVLRRVCSRCVIGPNGSEHVFSGKVPLLHRASPSPRHESGSDL